MLRSMTGFGRSEGTVAGKKVTVEIRSLNSKQLDLFIKLPPVYREKDAELRQWAADGLVRGKVELVITSEPVPGAERRRFNEALILEYYQELHRITLSVDKDIRTDLMGTVLRMPEVHGSAYEEVSDAEWNGVLALLQDAGRAFNGFRDAEGGKLFDDLRQRTGRISALLAEVDAQDSGRVERTRERIHARLAELRIKVDQDRFEQELVFYLEKMDINEEKVRLRAHCAYFAETLEGERQQGRKLGFIAQEMGREINTIGSKANDAAMQRNVVLMKDELEKIKEQVLNVL
ncbi:MAG: YicC family protein [Bacteroidetes bacterium]|nr:YicC family protein [Bacteroidota bacterium]MBX7128767.1 YicC family protein [Flavobacteriales bacterium]MCC6653564.1 YicC family protein [Flavobacteriales bacterium]HMU15610.1 YicC family protein [Flavobacteriales bacterium]HNE82131.1 YicC family protein [Flavobacteriales bacterium]